MPVRFNVRYISTLSSRKSVLRALIWAHARCNYLVRSRISAEALSGMTMVRIEVLTELTELIEPDSIASVPAVTCVSYWPIATVGRRKLSDHCGRLFMARTCVLILKQRWETNCPARQIERPAAACWISSLDVEHPGL
jgi:hypothetical protein